MVSHDQMYRLESFLCGNSKVSTHIEFEVITLVLIRERLCLFQTDASEQKSFNLGRIGRKLTVSKIDD